MSTKRELISAVTVVTLLVMVLFSACSSAQKLPDEGQQKMTKPWVFSVDFEKAVFKTDMIIFGNELSGLTMIKKNGDDYRVVFMSEIGLKYFDMEFFTKNDSIKIHHMITMLDKKQVYPILENNFSLVFMMFPEKSKVRNYRDNMTKKMIKEYKFRSEKSRYNYNSNSGIVSSIHQKRKGTKLVISLHSFDYQSPQTLNFNQNNFSLRLDKIEP